MQLVIATKYYITVLGKEKKEGKLWLTGEVNLVIEYIKKD
jgi:hypothetical protein